MDPTPTPSQLLERIVACTNAHDLDGLVDCFADDYELTDPLHPARSFTGAAQVRKNWGTAFAAFPDIHLEVTQQSVTDNGFWLEAKQVGTRRDGLHLDGRMVFIAAVADGRIASAHIYVGPVEAGGPGIDAVFAAMAGNTGPTTLAGPAGQPLHSD